MSAVRRRAAYWPVPVARAVPALVIGVVIALSADHSPQLGLVAFAVFALVTGAVLACGATLAGDRVVRGISFAHAAVAVIAGAVAAGFNASGLGLLLFLLTTFAAVSGFLELYAGLRARGRHPAARDWLVVGAFTALAALVFLILPIDAVQTVGLFGAYCVMVGIFLVIAGLSLKWAERPALGSDPVDGSQAGSGQTGADSIDSQPAASDPAK